MFELTKRQSEMLEEWLEKQDKISIDKQKIEVSLTDPFYDIFKESWEQGFPYSGTTGSNITYCFTPTTLGMIVKVKHHVSLEEIDLTEYDKW